MTFPVVGLMPRYSVRGNLPAPAHPHRSVSFVDTSGETGIPVVLPGGGRARVTWCRLQGEVPAERPGGGEDLTLAPGLRHHAPAAGRRAHPSVLEACPPPATGPVHGAVGLDGRTGTWFIGLEAGLSSMIHPVFESWVNRSHVPPREQARNMMPLAASRSRTQRGRRVRCPAPSRFPAHPSAPFAGIRTGRRADGADMPPSTSPTAGGMLP